MRIMQNLWISLLRSEIRKIIPLHLRLCAPAYFLAAAILMLLLAAAGSAFGGSATWNLNPVNSDWNTAANWTPPTVPNGSSDTATFGVSNITAVSTSTSISLSAIVFNAGASAYTITTSPPLGGLHFFGAGITNNSGIAQNFVNTQSWLDFDFWESSTAGSQTYFTATGDVNGGVGGVGFRDTSSAGNGTFTANASSVSGEFGAQILFLDHTTAADGTFYANGSEFEDPNSSGGIALEGHSNADNATIIARDGLNGGAGGFITFFVNASGGTARLGLLGDGHLGIISGPNGASVTVGSIEGDGLISLAGPFNLTVGSNNLSTIFSGLIQNDGSLRKIGTGNLILTNENTYTGTTTINQGVLLATNTSGSATGPGAVSVAGGTLGGSGIISGSVTVGTGSGTGANLAPAFGRNKQVTLTLQSSLTLQADATYTYTFKARMNQARTDLVIANGITINGATIALQGTTQGALTPGTELTLISNTSANPISGTFSNLADGAIVTVNGNNLQASYEGGDGNDLTLTVVP